MRVRAGRAGAIALRQFYLVRGSMSRLIPVFAWVTVDVIVWGFITRYLSTVTEPGASAVPALLGTVLLWNFLTRVMHGVTMAFFEDVWARNFLNVFASPLRISEYLSGLVLSSVATSAVGLVVMVLVASLAFGLSLAAYGALAFAFLLVLFLFGIALGIVGAAIVLRLGPAAEWFVWPIPALLSPFVGVFYPVATLPAWMRGVAWLLPPSYVFEGARALVAGGALPSGALLRGVGLSMIYIVLACWLFTHIYRRAVRSGLLARYSAESVS